MSRPESLTSKRWQFAEPVPDQLLQALPDQHPVIIQVLYNRNIHHPAAIQAFLHPQPFQTSSATLMPDMEKVVDRLKQALDNDELVIVYGDFDADGVTATVLMVEALRGMGFARRQAQPYIPDRVDEGYGLNFEALTALKEKGADLILTVDCGIRALNEVRHAIDIGLDIIITDHHSLGVELPPALAVVNPKRHQSNYPDKNLAGVGVAFKVAQALQEAFPNHVNFEQEQFLDLVALGTVADIVPLVGENRQLVIEGLQVLNTCQRPGIEALAKVAGLKPGGITAESIAFGLAPRINAAGRLAHAYDAARLLAVNNTIMANDYAQILNQLNRQRQQLTKQMSEQAEGLVDPDAPLLFAADSQFLSGVVGLVASRLSEKYYRPAIIIEQGDDESRGSCRSIPEFHITQALDQVALLLERHGGHAQAAGFTIRNENLTAFRDEMVTIAQNELDLDDLAPVLHIDAELNVDDIDWALQKWLTKLEPTGEANNTPIFASRDVHVYTHRAVGQDGAHLQLSIGDGRVKHECIAFRQGAWAGRLPDSIDLAYSISVNEWNGQRKLQLIVQDIQESKTQEMY